MKIYEYSIKNSFTIQNIAQNLHILTQNYNSVCFVFVGTDANMGDSLGPLTGTLTDFLCDFCHFYGSLQNPITAKEVPFIENFIKNAHPNSFIVVIDAALGKNEDVGLIKVLEGGIQPGLGVNKNLPKIGDASIIGVMNEKSPINNMNLTITRLSLVYNMANTIKEGILLFLRQKQTKIGQYKKVL